MRISFTNRDGAERFLALRFNVAKFVFQRILPDSAGKAILTDDGKSVPMSTMIPLEMRASHDSRSFTLFWKSLLEAASVDDLLSAVASIQKDFEARGQVAGAPMAWSTVKPDPGADAPENKVAITKFIGDTNLCKIPDTDGTPAEFRIVLGYLNMWAVKKYAVGAGKTADNGYSSLYSTDNGQLACKLVSKNLLLDFYGDISLTPSEGPSKSEPS